MTARHLDISTRGDSQVLESGGPYRTRTYNQLIKRESGYLATSCFT